VGDSRKGPMEYSQATAVLKPVVANDLEGGQARKFVEKGFAGGGMATTVAPEIECQGLDLKPLDVGWPADILRLADLRRVTISMRTAGKIVDLQLFQACEDPE
jgi:hypothetical protein